MYAVVRAFIPTAADRKIDCTRPAVAALEIVRQIGIHYVNYMTLGEEIMATGRP